MARQLPAGRRSFRSLRCASVTLTARAQRDGSSAAFQEVPVLRMPPPDAAHHEESSFSRELRTVCHNIGFFYVSNHGVQSETFANAIKASKRFFDLDVDQKMEIDYLNSPAFRGYIQFGAENTAGRPDRREQVEFGVDSARPDSSEGDKGFDQNVPFYKRLIGPNQWPDAHVPELRHAVGLFMTEMEVLSRRLMKYLALSLALPGDYFDSTFGDCPNVQLKICRYPPAESSDGFGVGAHTDSGYLSLLLQDEVGGLQVQNGEGVWIDAPPMPGTIVVNLGEMLQLCTNGYFLATPHRVINLQSDARKARYSVPYFWNPHLDFRAERIDPLPDVLSWDRPQPSFDSIDSTSSHGENGNKLISCYGENAFKSLARSHPEVMARHHNDLMVLANGEMGRAG